MRKHIKNSLKFQDKIAQKTFYLSANLSNNFSPSISNTWLSFSSNQDNYENSTSTQGNLAKLFYKINRYEKYIITASTVKLWNKIQKQLKYILLKDVSPNKI